MSYLYCTRKQYINQRFIEIAYLCDRLLFEHGSTLLEFETTILGKVAGRYRGNASPKKLEILSRYAGHVGLKMRGQNNA